MIKQMALLFLALGFANASGPVSQAEEIKVRPEIDWPTFLSRHDLVWSKLPTRWEEAPYFGNGNLGSMLYLDSKRNAIRLQVFRVDVQDHRDNTHGWTAYSRPRLMIGSFYLNFDSKITGGNWRQHLHDAKLTGTIETEAGTVELEHYVHAEQMVMATTLNNVNSPGHQSCHWTWEPEPAETTRSGYPRTEEQRDQFAKKYSDWYRDNLKLYEPNPEVVVTSQVDGNPNSQPLEGLSVQDLKVGGQYAVAWKTLPLGNQNEQHLASIEKTYPEREAATKAEANLDKFRQSNPDPFKTHQAWWHAYYPASFVSIPDTRLESFYWQQMYKLACATRADRPMMDTAGPWIQPTPWPYITWDLNVQLCYWPVCASNRLELGESLINTLHKNRQNLIENVRPVEWQADSAYIPVTTAQDLIDFRGSDKRYKDCFGNLPWALHNVWLTYRHSMDDTMLRDRLFPLLRRSINMYRHLLIEKEDGLHLPRSYSPEEGHASDCNYDLALLRWGCQTLLWSCERLAIDDPLIPEWQRILDQLVDFPVDENGFRVGADRPFARSHRHYSHLLMAYPLYLVNQDQGPAERELIAKSLKHWVGFEGALVGYSYTGAASLSAAIGNGDDALEYLQGLSRFLQPNGLYKEAGPVMETPLSAAQSLHDMMLQSWGETIRIFPAAPTEWKEMVFHDLRAEGAFLVSAKRQEGKTVWVRVKSLAGEPCRLRPGIAPETIHWQANDAAKINEVKPGVYEINLPAGEEIVCWDGFDPPDLTVKPLPAEKGKINSFGL